MLATHSVTAEPAQLEERAGAPPSHRRPVRVIRLIARLNVGGPAIHTLLLTEALRAPWYDSVLVAGSPEGVEGDLSEEAVRRGLRIVKLPALRRSLSPWRDLLVWCAIFRLFRRERPDIVHTHTAKAGALGRSAALAHNLLERWLAPHRHAPARIARIVHTFHGHVLEGYFGRMRSRMFLDIERWLARYTDRIVAVSPTVREDLLRRGIGSESRLRVIPLGLPLDKLLSLPLPEARSRILRVGIIGRLVPIKHHELFLQVASRCRQDARLSAWQFVIVGDGERRAALERLAGQLGLDGAVTFVGWQADATSIYRDLDIICLTSLNEGTPVSLIEALAAGRPVVATDVGGVRDVVGPAREVDGALIRTPHGFLVPSGDAQACERALRLLADHPEERTAMGRAGREHVRMRYAAARLIRDIEALYAELLA